MWPKQPLTRVSVKFGFLAAVFGCLFGWILYTMDRHPFLVPVFFDFRIVLLAFSLFFTLRELRERYYNGILFFWQGMIASAMHTLVFALCTSLAVYAFAGAHPEFVSDYVRLFREQAAAFPPDVVEKIGKETMDRNLRAIAATKPADLAVLYAWQSGLISLFVSVVIAVILRRQPKTPPNP